MQRGWCLFLGRALENTSKHTQASRAVRKCHPCGVSCLVHRVATVGVFVLLLGSDMKPISLLRKVNVRKNGLFSRFGWHRRFMVLVIRKLEVLSS